MPGQNLSAPGSPDVNGYALRALSPLRHAGMPVAANGGRDFWGNPVEPFGIPDIGAGVVK